MALIFYAFTASQLINMYNIRCNIYFDDDAELYVELGSRIPNSIVKSIEESNVFKSIIVNSSCNSSNSQSSLKNKCTHSYLSRVINTLIRWYRILKTSKIIGNFLFSVESILRVFNYCHQCLPLIKRIGKNLHADSSVRVFVGTCGCNSTIIIKHLLRKTKDVSVCLVDEGTANYYLDKLKMCFEYKIYAENSLYFKYLCMLNGLDDDFFSGLLKLVNENYLYQPEAYAYPNQYSLKKIPSINKNNNVYSLLKDSVSSLDINDYADRHIYYLLQEPEDAFEKCLSEILATLNHSDLLLKEHPWYRVMDNLSINPDLTSVYVDKRTDAFIFEALCTHIDFNNRVIITEFSSAAFTPKFMFDVEPYVVFLYNIIDEGNSEKIKSCEFQMDALIKLYQNPAKIYAPKSIDELRDVLKSLPSMD